MENRIDYFFSTKYLLRFLFFVLLFSIFRCIILHFDCISSCISVCCVCWRVGHTHRFCVEHYLLRKNMFLPALNFLCHLYWCFDTPCLILQIMSVFLRFFKTCSEADDYETHIEKFCFLIFFNF